MQLKHLTLLAASHAASVTAQQTLGDVLNTQAETLSSLASFLQSEETIYEVFNNARDVTLLAPSNDALAKIQNTPLASSLLADPQFLTAFLSYHVLNGTFYASNLTTEPTQFIPTLLDLNGYSSITGGQRLQVQTDDSGGVSFLSGDGTTSLVTSVNFNYTGGTIHVIDNVVTIPANVSTTLLNANLTATLGAVVQAGVADTLTNTRDLTIFAPTNAAFEAIGNLVAGLTAEELANILGYHVIPGAVVYSTDVTDGASVASLQGEELNFRVVDGNVWVNSAKVVQANVLIANGVVHVIDGVLNPANADAQPNPAASSPAPAFSGASSTGGVPFTSGIVAPTSTSGPAPSASGSDAPVTAGAAPMKTAAVAAAALFGGAAAVLANL
ncbi:FAS1 domain-containing protein [Podospora australis]|uniref:FAS1 domain-containing protein n=1 Tax=Podospora australis TaxID=1536484 RepID=A0AAN6WNZ5_9PEZI|nr:FAS1 domain-containing protein [Podospora australis]